MFNLAKDVEIYHNYNPKVRKLSCFKVLIEVDWDAYIEEREEACNLFTEVFSEVESIWFSAKIR
jgi:hypothetical protein